jgi:hypothetical protein
MWYKNKIFMINFFLQYPLNTLFIILMTILFVAGRELSEHAKENGFVGWGLWWNTGQSHINKHEWDDIVLARLSNWFPIVFSKMLITEFVSRILSAAFKTGLV